MYYRFLIFSLGYFLSWGLSSQIYLADSSAQIIGYWSIGDKQSYSHTYEKFKVTGSDTTSRMMIRYDVDITIKDSTENSYTIEWFYKNYEIDTDNDLIRKISKIAQDISVIIKTNEYGAVQGVVNWEEVRDYIEKGAKTLRKELKNIPNADQIITQVSMMYSSKEAIEANAIKDALQFYTFHGGRYTLNEELTGQMQFANNYGGDPFDVDVSVSLDELNVEDDNSVIRMYQSVNSEQLTNATYEYLKNFGSFGDEMPLRSDFPPLTNEIWTASRIHGSTGWPTYSIETRKTMAENVLHVEERIIQIK